MVADVGVTSPTLDTLMLLLARGCHRTAYGAVKETAAPGAGIGQGANLVPFSLWDLGTTPCDRTFRLSSFALTFGSSSGGGGGRSNC